ncbi:hypothetical protein EB74_11625 [Mycobacterium sp. SWH-M5]|nr:hypothetical protein EB74_11625 [Mycobacterium sp. SWH-M5]
MYLTGVEVMAQQTTYLAAVTWDDFMFNLFDKFKVWAAIISFIVLAAAGVFALARIRLVGIGLLIASLVVPAFFLTAERWITITKNTEIELHQPSKGNPFNRV